MTDTTREQLIKEVKEALRTGKITSSWNIYCINCPYHKQCNTLSLYEDCGRDNYEFY